MDHGPGNPFFLRYAATYTTNPSHAHGEDLQELVQALRPQPHELALDVATGTGHTALALAPLVMTVLGLDLTAAMLAQAQKLAREKQVANTVWLTGDAMALPFLDGTFDLVTCRRAFHHFPRPAAALAEMARVLKPGGRLGVVDMTVPAGPGGRLFNALEWARDHTHVQALDDQSWLALATGAGLEITYHTNPGEFIPLPKWLYPVDPQSPEGLEVHELLRQATPEELAGIGWAENPAPGFVKRRIILVAYKRG